MSKGVSKFPIPEIILEDVAITRDICNVTKKDMPVDQFKQEPSYC